MAQIKPRLDPKKIAGLHDRPAWTPTIDFFNHEIVPLFEKLYDKNFDSNIKKSMRKYLIISITTIVEQYFINEAKTIVDRYDLDIADLFKDEICIPITNLDNLLKQNSVTKGNIVASSFNFANPDHIDEVFTKLLKLGFPFLDVIKKVEKSNRSRYVFRGHPIDINYDKFREVFRLRNAIVHEMRDVELSNWKLLSLWDNTMNILDAANMILMPENKEVVRQIVIQQIKKEAHHNKGTRLQDTQ